MAETVGKVAEAVLVAHQRLDCKGCLCGWAELAKSHAAHQVRMLADAGVLADVAATVQVPAHYQHLIPRGRR